MGLIFEGTAGEAVVADRLAMLQLGHLILGRGNHALGIGGQFILRTLIIKEAVETCEPERQPPSTLRIPEYLENLRHLFAGTMISRIEAIKRQIIFPAVLDREDL